MIRKFSHKDCKEATIQQKDSTFQRRKYKTVDGRKVVNMGKNKAASTGGKQWVHPPEALLRGHVVYHVKFLGHVEVEQPKGTEMVRDAIRKMKFNKQLKKAEGQKPPKVELTISVDGVTIQEPKYKVIEHQYPLHRISYCADDKSDKRMFTFIAKEANSNKHHCFVFDSDKCAEEITLTIGQAFNLAYKKFVETSSKDIDVKKQYLLMQKKVQQLTAENLSLKERVADLERLVDPQMLENFDRNKQNGSSSTTETATAATTAATTAASTDVPVVGRKLENLFFEDDAPAPPPRPGSNGAGNVTSPTSGMPVLAPPPPVPSRNIAARTPQKSMDSGDVDLFGQTPFTAASPTAPAPSFNPTNPFSSQQQQGQQGPAPGAGGDPFGMGSFSPAAGGAAGTQSGADLDRQIQNMDQELLDLKTGFSQGLTFGTEDFSLQDLDPLNNSYTTATAAH